MAQFTGKIDIVSNVSFLNNTLLLNNGDTARATSMVRGAGCDDDCFATVTGRSTMQGTTPAIEISKVVCIGPTAMVARTVRLAAHSHPVKPPAPAPRKRAAKKKAK